MGIRTARRMGIGLLGTFVVIAVAWNGPLSRAGERPRSNGQAMIAWQEGPPSVPGNAESDDAGTRGMFRRFWPRWRAVGENERNHASVREAFRSVVSGARLSTVQVMSGKRRVAYGTVVDANGFVLTKASELEEPMECRLADGRNLAATLVTTDEKLDVAVLHVEATDLTPVSWREGDAPSAGSWLASVGSGEIPTSVGVVSVEPREIPTPRPVLGVMLETAEGGARVTSVVPDSPAQDAGIEVNDVVVRVNGNDVGDQESLVQRIRTMRPGDRVALVVKRGQSTIDVEARLADVHSLAQGRRVDFQNSLGGPLSERRWGFPSVLQHDTVLRPNDCGGPIVDLEGRVVGINIARAGRVESYAIPVGALKPVLDGIREGRYGIPGRTPVNAARAGNGGEINVVAVPDGSAPVPDTSAATSGGTPRTDKN
ncbi:MAG: PDZ domain-containing protein [Planctomycetes bacterium]|nr:PDZ domain-containing protein [Planctomycetota bacterium]